MIVPSVCSLFRHLDITRVTSPKLIDCATKYARELSVILGSQFHDLILTKQLQPVVKLHFHRPDVLIVLNISPGSTGTSSGVLTCGFVTLF